MELWGLVPDRRTMTNSATASYIRSGAALRCSAVATCVLLLASPGALGEDGQDVLEELAASGILVVRQPVPLQMVTLGDKVTWSIQAVLAPDLLKAGTPLYAYPMDEALRVLERGYLTVAEEGSETDTTVDVVVDLDWYVGTAVREGEDWEAYPIPAGFRPLVETAVQLNLQRSQLTGSIGQHAHLGVNTAEVIIPAVDPNDLYVVSNLALTELDVAERLWIPKAAWTGALEEFDGGEVHGILMKHLAQERYMLGSL